MGQVTARFTADFATFNDAVQKASTNLDNFDSSVRGIGSRLQSTFDQFSGRALVEQATLMTKAIGDLGDVTKLTADEQDRAAATLDAYIEKQTALGNAIPPATQALRDQIQALQDKRAADEESANATQAWAERIKGAIQDPTGALKDFGTSAVDAAADLGPLGIGAGAIATVAAGAGAAIMDLANKAAEAAAKVYEIGEMTNTSAPQIAALGYAFQAAGGSIDGLNTLMYTFDQRMETSGAKVEAGLEQIGLSLQQIQEMPADQRILAISDALRGASDDTNKAAVAFEIFGKQGRENLPLLLKPLSDLADEAHKVGAVMSDEDAKAAEDYEATLRDLSAQSDATWNSIGRQLEIGRTLSTIWAVMKVGAADFIQSLIDLGDVAHRILPPIPELIRPIGDELNNLPKVAGPAAADVKKAFDTTSTSFQGLLDAQGHFTAASAAQIKDASRVAIDAAEASIAANKKAAEEAKKYGDEIARTQAQVATAQANIDALTEGQNWDGSIEGALKLGASVHDLALVLNVSDGTIQRIKLDQAEAAKAAQQQTELQKKEETELQSLMKSGSEQVLANLKLQNAAVASNLKEDEGMRQQHQKYIEQQTLSTFDYQRQQVSDWVDDEEGKLNYSVDNWQKAYNDIHQVAADKYNAIKQAEADALTAMKAQELSWSNEATKLFEGLPGMITAATSGTSGAFTKALEGTVSGMGGDIGGKLFAAGGPLSALGGQMSQGLSKILGSGVGDAFGLALPGIGTAIGGMVGPLLNKIMSIGGPSAAEQSGRQLEAQFEQSFGGFQQMITAVGQAYEATGKTAQQAQSDVQSLMDAEKQGPAAVQQWITALQGATSEFQQQGTDIQAAEQAAQKYGITLQELGPALQKQELDQQAQQLYQDFQTLTAAGVDSTVVMDHMSTAVNTYVQNALAMGQEVPDAMEPMLQKMADAGELTDANGNKITDLGAAGIQFSMTMSEGFQKLIDSVNQLSTVLSHGLGVALTQTTNQINAMPKSVDVAVNYQTTVSGQTPPGSTTQTVPGFQTGTGEKFMDFGAGTLVMLHGKEAVVPQDSPILAAGTIAATASSAAPAAAAAPTIVINAQGGFFDTPGDLQRLADKVNAALTAKYGLSNRMRAT